ncbi:MAG: ABC transporter ATP-binding protein [Peptococcaceae bacterium]
MENLSYSYGQKYQQIFDKLSFNVQDSEFTALVGPSGCGKTTLFHILAGLIDDFSGEVVMNGTTKDLLGKISLMPQQDLLLPWRTVVENGALPLEIKGVGRKEAQKEVRELLTKFGLQGYENLYPYQLSGGMRQRVAFLRSILTGSQVLLLDEPFSALDALTRMKMQQWLMDMWREFKPTIIFITHDVEEALFLAQRVLLLGYPPNGQLKDYAVDFSYPRDKQLLGDPKFIELRQNILAGLDIGDHYE